MAKSIPSHMSLWVDDDSPFLTVDRSVMFGCRAAACNATRASNFLCWLMDEVGHRIHPEVLRRADSSPYSGDRWDNLVDWFKTAAELRAEARRVGVEPAACLEAPALAFVNAFIDDFPTVAVAGVGRTMLALFAALLDAAGLPPQGKKVYPEGDFQDV